MTPEIAYYEARENGQIDYTRYDNPLFLLKSHIFSHYRKAFMYPRTFIYFTHILNFCLSGKI